jgi:riboflavin biosynthesis pyrimidine reductase
MPMTLAPLELLHEPAGLPSFDLPAELAECYPGSLGFEQPRLYANFVSTVDGVVSIPSVPLSHRLIGADSEQDRFVMGLLRACADAVLIGAGTLRASPRLLWLPDRVYPAAADAFAELRRRLGRAPQPQLAVLTGSGSIDPAHPALEAGALVITTDRGLERLGGLPEASEAISLGDGDAVDTRAAVELLRDRGHGLILSEAGPRVFGSLLHAGLVDELFLTVSPLIAGRAGSGGRLSLVEGVDLLPLLRVEGRLLGVRRHEAHLFLRYELPTG